MGQSHCEADILQTMLPKTLLPRIARHHTWGRGKVAGRLGRPALADAVCHGDQRVGPGIW